MDYATQTRIKILGTATVVEHDPDLLAQLHDSTYRGRPERVIQFHVEAWDVNCRQHIKPRFSKEEIASQVKILHDRTTELEAENELLKSQIPSFTKVGA